MTSFFARFLRGDVEESEIDVEIERWHTSGLIVPLHAHLGMTRAEFAAYMADARSLVRMRDARARRGAMRRVGEFEAVMIDNGEPNADENFDRLRAVWPTRPLLIDGRAGLHAALRSAGRQSRTTRFVVVEGDCAVRPGAPDLTIDELERSDAIFCFPTRNSVNGIESVAGGLRIWPKSLPSLLPDVQGSPFTEPSAMFRCWIMPETVADSAPASPAAAFRMGYVETARLSFIGEKRLPRLTNAMRAMPVTNQSRMLVWLSVGADHAHGEWTLLGARRALFDLYDQLADAGSEQTVDQVWQEVRDCDPMDACAKLQTKVANLLGLPLCLLDPQESIWFKRTYINPIRQGFADITLLPVTLPVSKESG